VNVAALSMSVPSRLTYSSPPAVPGMVAMTKLMNAQRVAACSVRAPM
jgi:hypothetical protein